MKAHFYKDLNESNAKTKPDLHDVSSIKQNILNLILTVKGTRPFDPEFGLDIDSHLFELLDEGAGLTVLNDISIALSKYDPRVSLEIGSSEVVGLPDTNEFYISLYFKISGYGDTIFDVSGVVGR